VVSVLVNSEQFQDWALK